MGHALMNSIIERDGLDHLIDVTERYAYKRESRLVNEYARTRSDGTPFEGDAENPNHLLGSFPTLFPYGKGGFETERSVKVSYERHIRWAMTYHNKWYSPFFSHPKKGCSINKRTVFDYTNNFHSKYLAFFKSDKCVVLYHWRSKSPPSFNTHI